MPATKKKEKKNSFKTLRKGVLAMSGKKPEHKDPIIRNKQEDHRKRQKRGSISQKDLKILCTRSGNRCAMPECKKILIENKKLNDTYSIIGEAAHINGKSPNSARYDGKMTEKERDSYDNLILVCRNCHKAIDDQPSFYTAEKLHQIKEDHERWIIESTGKEAINVTFAELDLVTKHLASGKFQPERFLHDTASKGKNNEEQPVGQNGTADYNGTHAGKACCRIYRKLP